MTKMSLIASQALEDNYEYSDVLLKAGLVTTTKNGLMLAIDKVKLDALLNYTHPASHPPSIITQDTSNRFVTDAEKTTWNGKAPTTAVTTGSNGLMIATDKLKLDGLSNYTHPASHPPSIITQDISNRFVTDAEKATWNAKAPTTAVTTGANGLMIAADKLKLDGLSNYTHPANHPPSIITQDSSNRFVTDAEKTQWNASNNYVHPATHPPSIIVQDISNRFVTDAEKTTWNSKAPTTPVTTGANGLMIASDKLKLDGLSNYTHPANHPPSIIVQDTNNRFVTDAEKAIWNAGGGGGYVHPATHPPSIIVQDTSNRFVTDAEKTTWNAKAPTTPVTTGANGLMLATDKVKIDGLSNYSHPATHPPSIIVQDASNRFVTDAEKATWNAGGSPTAATVTIADAGGRFIANNVEGALTELFQFANDGKTKWSTVVGSPLVSGDTFTQMESKTQTIKTDLAANLSLKGISANGAETLTSLVSKVGTVPTGGVPTVAASNMYVLYNDTGVAQTEATVMTKMKEYTMNMTGSVIVTYTAAKGTTGTVSARMYKNGVATGTLNTTSTSGTYSDTVSFTPSDKIQIYGLTSNTLSPANVSNVKFSAAEHPLAVNVFSSVVTGGM